MPIYAYRCTSCGHAKDVLQRVSDPPLTDCPSCGASTYMKQLTAAGFHLKGSGWYATDFKGGPPASKPDNTQAETAKSSAETTSTPAPSSAAKPEKGSASGPGTGAADSGRAPAAR